MNTYRFNFIAVCPTNGESIHYSFQLHTHSKVMVEEIKKACLEGGAEFHEDIADRLYQRFGGHQTIIAKHHGVEIETQRGI